MQISQLFILLPMDNKTIYCTTVILTCNYYKLLRFIYAFPIGLVLLINVQSIIAQNTISGTIEDNNHNPLAGANISIKNTTLGTASDMCGNYLLGKLKEGNYMVRVSFFWLRIDRAAGNYFGKKY